LQLFAQGRSNKEIAKGMFLSNKTVSTYKTRLMQKLKTRTLVELIEMAKRNALVYCLKNKCSVKSSMLAR
ncbi:LuxR C-terminal-related transcriptional regulator, partial [Pseudomonas syringae pv. actinidiae]|nr:LuxR C-terminal-related transcriptional regulator [Pseudomonas syringae pv. actinidiae]